MGYHKLNPTSGTLVEGPQGLTGSWVNYGGVITCSGYDRLDLLVDFIKNNSTQLDIKIEFSKDGTNFFGRIVTSTGADGTSDCLDNLFKRTTSGSFIITTEVQCVFMKISFKLTGTDDGTFGARYILDNVNR